MNDFQLGSTGKFPEGKLNPSDRGEIRALITHKQNIVILDFGKTPVTWIGINPGQAMYLAAGLMKHAELASAAQNIIVAEPEKELHSVKNDLPKGKPILCLDFDGVIHSYSSGWKGAVVINDPIIPGAIEFILNAMKHFKISIFSSRSHQWGGRRAMKRYLRNEFIKIGLVIGDWENGLSPTEEKTAIDFISKTASADPWEDEVEYAADRFISSIGFPFFKPPAFLTIDDRGFLFNGIWPNPEQLLGFRPWNKKKEC